MPDTDKPTLRRDPIIPYADRNEAPPDLKPMLDFYEQRMGFFPNALAIYLHRPHLLKQIIRLNNAVMRHDRNVLSEEFKYRLSFLISRNHGCRYCCAHEAHTLREKYGLKEEAVLSILQLQNPRDEREAVAWEFVHKASQGAGHVTDDLRRRLAEHFTAEEIVEIACVVGFWAFFNRVHTALDVPLEEHLWDEGHWVDVPSPDAA